MEEYRAAGPRSLKGIVDNDVAESCRQRDRVRDVGPKIGRQGRCARRKCDSTSCAHDAGVDNSLRSDAP